MFEDDKKDKFLKSRDAYQKIKDMRRSDIRYRLYRLRNNIELDTNDGIREYYEAQTGFTGWKDFANKWDIGKGEGPEKFKIVRKLLTELEEWEAIVRQHAG